MVRTLSVFFLLSLFDVAAQVDNTGKDKAVRGLAEKLATTTDRAVQRDLLVAIGRHRPELVEPLKAILNETDTPTLNKTYLYLGRMGIAAKPASPVIRKTVADLTERHRGSPSNPLVKTAAHSLAIIAPDEPETIELAVDLVRTKGKEKATIGPAPAVGIAMLGEIASARPELKKSLAKKNIELMNLYPKSPEWGAAFLDTLEKLGADGKEAIPEVRKLLSHPSPQIRAKADKLLTIMEGN